MVSLASMERAPGVIAPSVGGSLKRKHSDADFSGANLPSSQIKKRRVTFDPDVDVRILTDGNDKSEGLVQEEVRRAFARHASGDTAPYDQLRSLLTANPTSSDAPLTGLLQKYVRALANNVSLLDHNCKGMVHAIIDCSWIARNKAFVNSYRLLLRSLLSVHPASITPVLHMLAGMFLVSPSPFMRQQDDPSIDRAQLQVRIHETLKYILRCNSMASTYLASILNSNWPYHTEPTKVYLQYVNHILKVSEYCPEIKGEILSLIMGKVVQIDVKLQMKIENMEDDVEDILERVVDENGNENDGEDDESDNESFSSAETLDPEEQEQKELKESIMKLDCIMDILFSHYDTVFASGDRFDMDQVFESLLNQFSSIILPNYRSRHTQFLLFRFSQLSQDLIERFTGCCSHMVFDNCRPAILRTSAASYLASFIARGAHVPGAHVRDLFDLLCQQLESLRISQERASRGPDLRRHGTYYAVSQALIYTFCFRWRDLIVTPDGEPLTDEDIIYHEGDFNWYKSTQEILRRNIFSKLNPLKICAPSIVAQFAKVAHHLRFLYIYPLIETNKRIRLARGLTDNKQGVMTALSMRSDDNFLLDAYFPFDPYTLPKSKRWITADFVEWKPIPGMPIERDEEDDEDDVEEEDESESEREVEEIQDDDLDEGDSTEVSM